MTQPQKQRDVLDDARRYQLLAALIPNILYIGRNTEHADSHVTAKKWIEEYDMDAEFDRVDPEELQKMKDTNTIWSLQIYPITPIGSYTIYGASLDSIVDQLSEMIATIPKIAACVDRGAE